ncbi:MAG: hypothetical protein DMG51_02365 [Acidobacteria bacterium]|nr:MAG: hypothetical protein DMG51_02365 [Acidobacteriota bacterium]
MDGGCAGLQFSTGIFVNPDFVADGHRTIFRGAAPVALSTGLQGDRTIDVADAGDACWRIFFFICPGLRSHQDQNTSQTQQQA